MRAQDFVRAQCQCAQCQWMFGVYLEFGQAFDGLQRAEDSENTERLDGADVLPLGPSGDKHNELDPEPLELTRTPRTH